MAVAATGLRVFAFQWKFRIAGVIETGIVPISRVVAGFTLVATAAVVGIVGLMAAETCRRRIGEGLILVAVKACGVPVFA